MNDNLNFTSPKPQPTSHTRNNSHWYSPETGIYHSKHPPVNLPTYPFLDVVSHIFSKPHNGVSALIDSTSGHTIPYSDLYPLVKSMASGLHQMGISPGDVVLILLPNSIYFPVIVFGVLYLGAVVTTMNPLSTLPEIKKQTLDSNATLAFTLPDCLGKFHQLGIRAIAVPETGGFDLKQMGVSDFDKLIGERNPISVPRPVIRQEDTAAIMYSSGTTGTCKGVVLTHRNLISMIELFVRFEASQYEYSREENVHLVVMPMFHIYGLSHSVLGLLSLGSTVVVMRKFDADEMVKAIGRYRFTHFTAVPPLLVALTAKAKSGYGMTESTAVGSRGFNTKKCRKHFSMGLMAPNMEASGRLGYWLLLASWEERRTLVKRTCCYESSDLIVCSNLVGYLNNPEATAITIDEHGWLRTGDIVYFDEEGYLHILDRLKEIIKYKGFQIAPAELEAVFVTHPDILDAAVTSAKDEKAGEVPMAFVLKRQGSLLSEAVVKDYVATQVAPYKKVRKVVFTHSIPRSAAGKILRRELRGLISRI
ncbi:hypothetical protein RHMOL_Rhmol07G0163800 [Rhododendron molle]|uniref:Uncharacterized protein n=1 Tax=Rhododendron molle TaxID=49168 RepID=A0ACC0N2D8_RHOML|nr:hypothetical protein RHMOL_Rhmol07G0163800 [Rhododendron molle]